MSEFNRIEDAGDLTGKTALVRVDFNVPMAEGKVTDDTRLRAAVETVQTLRTQGGKVALLAHFGRPKGERKPEMSLAPVAHAFEAVLGSPVAFAADCKGPGVAEAIDALPPAGVILLENTRYYAGEEQNDPALPLLDRVAAELRQQQTLARARRRADTGVAVLLAEVRPDRVHRGALVIAQLHQAYIL